MKTFVATAENRQRDWLVVDAEGQTLGRLATQIADALLGKRKPTYTPHVDTGDFIVVTNVEKLRVTGTKTDDKLYHRHSGYPGGLKTETAGKLRQRRPTQLVERAVWGMLPKTKLGRAQRKKLKVYAGGEHPHQAQKPEPLDPAKDEMFTYPSQNVESVQPHREGGSFP